MNKQNKLQFWFTVLQSSIGYYPSILTALAIVLAFVLEWIDRLFIGQFIQNSPWLFGGSADAARGLLSTIATSLITVVSISFSITIIALQQAATNYSPRVLRTFTSDKGNQIVLGMYLATFTYALLILRTVRSETTDGNGFVPAISIAVAILLTLGCLGLLIYFINKMFNSLQAVEIVKRIHEAINKEFESLYPEKIGRDAKEVLAAEDIMKKQKQSANQLFVRAKKAGFVNLVNEKLLSQIKDKPITWVYIHVKIGDFVNKGDTIAKVDNKKADEKVENILHEAIEIHDIRSIQKDPLFGFRQLVDIALRAISPGVNDPTTAEYVLRYMGDSLKQLAQRKFPENKRNFDGTPVLFILTSPSWEDYISLAFSQLRREAKKEYRILQVLLEILSGIGRSCDTLDRKQVIIQQVNLVKEVIQNGDFSVSDKNYLLDMVKRTRKEII